jgi:hypothetical protein
MLWNKQFTIVRLVLYLYYSLNSLLSIVEYILRYHVTPMIRSYHSQMKMIGWEMLWASAQHNWRLSLQQEQKNRATRERTGADLSLLDSYSGVVGSNLGRDTGYSEFLWFSSVSLDKWWNIALNMPRPLLLKSFPIHLPSYHPMLYRFDTKSFCE